MLPTLATLLLTLPAAQSNVLRIPASHDNTLIESSSGALSSGAGSTIYVGRTNQFRGSIRRAVLRFDLEGALPANVTIVRARLIVKATATHLRAHDIRVQRMLQDWGEGASVSFGGIGAPSRPDDATWIHAFYPGVFWPRPGGNFSSRASAMSTVKRFGAVVWESPGLLRDVVAWQREPHENFGWILIGNEGVAGSVTQFLSRENLDPTNQPVLEITFKRLPGPPR